MIVVWIASGVVGIYLLIVMVFLAFQSRFLYLPERVLRGDPGKVGLTFERVAFRSDDGVKLTGWFVPRDASRGVLLLCHGNASNIGHESRLELIRLFHDLGLDVFVFDYRGYGESEGTPSEKGTYDDAEAAWNYLVGDRRIDPGRIVVIGRSLGGSVASWLASRHTPGALIVESAFTSLRDVAALHYGFLPVNLILRMKYDTKAYISSVQCPVLVIHSRNDEVNPFDHGKRLYEIAPSPKRFLELEGTHNEGFITSRNEYQKGIDSFIGESLEVGRSRATTP